MIFGDNTVYFKIVQNITSAYSQMSLYKKFPTFNIRSFYLTDNLFEMPTER